MLVLRKKKPTVMRRSVEKARRQGSCPSPGRARLEVYSDSNTKTMATCSKSRTRRQSVFSGSDSGSRNRHMTRGAVHALTNKSITQEWRPSVGRKLSEYVAKARPQVRIKKPAPARRQKVCP